MLRYEYKVNVCSEMKIFYNKSVRFRKLSDRDHAYRKV